MDDTKNPSPPDSGDAERPLSLVELERALNEGIADLDAGRTVSAEESRREIEEILSAYENKRTPAP